MPWFARLWLCAPLVLVPACSRASSEHPAPGAELWLGGDVHIGQGDGKGLAPLSNILKDDIGIVNLEGPVATSLQPAPPGEDNAIYEPPADPSDLPLQLRNNPRALAALRKQGIRVMGIANNHAGDLGQQGREDTVKALYSAGILPAGELAGPAVFFAGAKKFVVAAFDLSPGTVNDLTQDLAQAKEQGDILITTFHVTGSPSYLPRPELRAAVDIALEAGARVIAAHGSHALGPIERRGNAVIAWGLGNLLFDCPCTDEIDGAILHIRLEGDAISARIIPLDAGLLGRPAAPAHNPALIFGLFDALGSSPIRKEVFRGVETGVF